MSKDAKWLTAARNMQNEAVKLQCPNDLCQTSNSQVDEFCQQCGTPLPKRYLWAVGTGDADLNPEDVLASRYLFKSNQIFLDTKPGLPPQTPTSEISSVIKPYLRLIPYRIHVPQVYGLVPPLEGRTNTDILLLEQAPIYADAVPLEGQLMPEITSVWHEGTSMRQLNWLWQIAQLWQPLSGEGVASTLLKPQLLRVEGSLVRLLQLQPDHSETPTLSQLGLLWSQLATLAKPSIAEFLENLSLGLRQGELQTAEQLITVLDQGLIEVGRSQARTLSIATLTDKGPSRQRNEDACYPVSGTMITKATNSQIAITCDGIGGHEGGSVASHLAIETLQSQVQQLQFNDAYLDATTIVNQLEDAICTANDQISERNDHEHRYGRQRMGTTLVMALGHAHEIYTAHVGDSRAYWITRHGCHQVTLDDDVASREVRLGYALYRDALQQSSSGSLVQALGMGSSVFLHPTVQRFILDEDCVFLLCSDGLSDYERVDQSWQTEISPILDSQLDVMTAGSRLIELANTQNGHDNVTVCLLYYQVKCFEPEAALNPSLTHVCNFSSVLSPEATLESTNLIDSNATSSTLKTQMLLSQHPSLRIPFIHVLLALILTLSLSCGFFVYLWHSSNLSTPAPSESATDREQL